VSRRRLNFFRDPFVWLPIVAWFGTALYAVGESDGWLKEWSPIIAAPALIAYVLLHGVKRYGRALFIWFMVIVFVIGWVSESIGSLTEFPFGNYQYSEVMAPFLGKVPVFVLIAYILMGYLSWSLATILLNQRGIKLDGAAIYTVPVVAAASMVVWDLSMDPLRATVEGRWVWMDGGIHYGVPFINYVGWFVVTWLMFQCFALLLRRVGKHHPRPSPVERGYWVSVPLAYLAFAVEYVLNPLTGTAGSATLIIAGSPVAIQQIFLEIAVLCLLTMFPLALFAGLRASRHDRLAMAAKTIRDGYSKGENLDDRR